MSLIRTIGTIGVVIGLGVTIASMRAGGQTLDPPGLRCDLSTLRGSYGVQWIGTRPAASPTGKETFTGIAIRTFDGVGNFTQVSNVKGEVVGVEPENIESFGTYHVNEDCTGSATSQFVPGAPIVTARFVIVDNGNEVLQSVMTPVPVFNAGVIRRIHSR